MSGTMLHLATKFGIICAKGILNEKIIIAYTGGVVDRMRWCAENI